MNILKTMLLMVLVVAAGSAAGIVGTRVLLAEPQRPDIERMLRPQELSEHRGPVVFTLSTCPACAQLKKWFATRELSFVEYSIDTDEAARALAKQLGIDSVPVIFTDTHRINGFVPEALAAHLPAPQGG